MDLPRWALAPALLFAAGDVQPGCLLHYRLGADIAPAVVAVELTSDGGVEIDGRRVTLDDGRPRAALEEELANTLRATPRRLYGMPEIDGKRLEPVSVVAGAAAVVAAEETTFEQLATALDALSSNLARVVDVELRSPPDAAPLRLRLATPEWWSTTQGGGWIGSRQLEWIELGVAQRGEGEGAVYRVGPQTLATLEEVAARLRVVRGAEEESWRRPVRLALDPRSRAGDAFVLLRFLREQGEPDVVLELPSPHPPAESVDSVSWPWLRCESPRGG